MAEFVIDVKVDPNRAKRGLDGVDRQLNKTERSANRLKSTFGTLFAGLSVALVVNQLKVLSDEFVTLQNRLRVVSSGMDQVNTSTDRLFSIANRARVPVSEITTLFQRASISSTELGASQDQLFQFVDGVSKALAVQGGSVSSARGALIQLSQAIGGTIVRAEEFNSIQEGALPILQAVAHGLDRAGGSVATLRQLVISGQVTSKEFFNAFLTQTDELDKKFSKTIPTIGQAFSVLNNNMVRFIGGSQDVQVAAGNIAELIIDISNNLGLMAKIIASIGLAAMFDSGAAAATRFRAVLVSIIPVAKLLGRALVFGAIIEGVTFLIDEFTRLNDIVKTGTVSWGDLAKVGIDKFVNNTLNGMIALVKSIPKILKLIVQPWVSGLSAIGSQFIPLLTGQITGEQASANIISAFIKPISDGMIDISNTFRDQFKQRLVEIASSDELARVGAALTPSVSGSNGGAVTEEISVTGKKPSIFTRFKTGFTDQFTELSSQLGTIGDQFSGLGAQVADIFGPSGTLITGISEGISQAIVFGESFGNILRNIGQQIVSQILNNLLKIGINFGLGALGIPGFKQGGLVPGYAAGGFTGGGGVNDVAGVVHGQEYVFDAAATRRIGVDNLDAMRRGRGTGGGSQTIHFSPTIYAQPGMSAKEIADEIDRRFYRNLNDAQRFGGQLEA